MSAPWALLGYVEPERIGHFVEVCAERRALSTERIALISPLLIPNVSEPQNRMGKVRATATVTVRDNINARLPLHGGLHFTRTRNYQISRGLKPDSFPSARENSNYISHTYMCFAVLSFLISAHVFVIFFFLPFHPFEEIMSTRREILTV